MVNAKRQAVGHGRRLKKMPRKYTQITPQIVEKAKKYLADDRNFSKAEVARLVGISDHSLARIIAGHYDEPKTEEATPKSTQQEKHITEIPYERLEHLMRCECFVSEMFSVAVKSDKDEDELYFPRHWMNNMCDRYFPNKKEEVLQKLNEADYDTYA